MCNVLQIIVCPFHLFLLSVCCLSFDLRILITPLVSSNSSYTKSLQYKRIIFEVACSKHISYESLCVQLTIIGPVIQLSSVLLFIFTLSCFNWRSLAILLFIYQYCISLSGKVWSHDTSLTSPLFIEVPVPSQESEWNVYVCQGYQCCLYSNDFLCQILELFRQCSII